MAPKLKILVREAPGSAEEFEALLRQASEFMKMRRLQVLKKVQLSRRQPSSNASAG
jgi:hypothetical protein